MLNTIDTGQKITLPNKRIAVALFLVASSSWSILIISWLVCLLSIYFAWEVPASGAVLVCGAVIAELFYENQRWTKMSTDPSGSFQLIPDSITGLPIINGLYAIAPAGEGKLGCLLSLARNTELNKNEAESQMIWFYKDTVRRIDKIIFFSVAVTAVLGTALWGYGHLIFSII